MFGRGRRKAQTAQATEVEVATPAGVVDVVDVVEDRSVTAPATAPTELDVTFMAMVAQLDDSLAAMARACDRIEQAVAGASRHHPAEADTVAAA